MLCGQHFEIDARAMLHKTGECKSELGVKLDMIDDKSRGKKDYVVFRVFTPFHNLVVGYLRVESECVSLSKFQESTRLVNAHALKSTMVLSRCLYVHPATTVYMESISSVPCFCCFRIPFHSLDRCLEHAERVCARSQVTLLRSLPVDDVPDVLDIGSLAVLVLEIVRMLPLKLELVTHDHCHEAKSDLPCRHQRWEPRPYQQQDLGLWSSR